MLFTTKIAHLRCIILSNSCLRQHLESSPRDKERQEMEIQTRRKQIRAFIWNTEAGIVSGHRRPRANWSQVKGNDLLAVGEKM